MTHVNTRFVRIALAGGLALLCGFAAPARRCPAQSSITGWGTLRGRFVVRGEPPKPKRIQITKDRNALGDSIEDPSLQVGPNGGLANVVIFFRTADIRVHPSYQASNTATHLLTTRKGRRTPYVVGMRVGQSLEMRNADPVGHNFFYFSSRGQAFNVLVRGMGKWTTVMKSPDRYPSPIRCSVHPWEQAYVFVHDSPYFAVTDKEGRFEIKNVPAGEHKLRFWHERLNVRALKIDGWKVGRRMVGVLPDRVKDLKDIMIPADAL